MDHPPLRSSVALLLMAGALALAIGLAGADATAVVAQEAANDQESGSAVSAPASSFQGPWYDHPVLAAVIGVGLLVIVVLAVLAARNGSGRPATSNG